MIFVGVEALNGDNEHLLVIWSDGEDLPSVFYRLAQDWQRKGNYPGDSELEPRRESWRRLLLIPHLLEMEGFVFGRRPSVAC